MHDLQEAMLETMALQMRREMEANEFKSNQWMCLSPAVLEHEILYHVVKLLWASAEAKHSDSRSAVCEFAADVANCAGMLAQRHAALIAPQVGNSSDYSGCPASAYGHQIARAMRAVLTAHLYPVDPDPR